MAMKKPLHALTRGETWKNADDWRLRLEDHEREFSQPFSDLPLHVRNRRVNLLNAVEVCLNLYVSETNILVESAAT